MSALPFPTYGLHHLYRFPVFQTREAYRQATGREAPPYDPAKPPKSWFDPDAAANPRRRLVYETVVAYAENGFPLVDAEGKPVLEPLVIDRDFAAVVNIPNKLGSPDQTVSGPEIPVPLRPLESGEEMYLQFGGSVAVKNKALFDAVATTYGAEDRALLRAIAEKLGVAR